MPIFNWSLNKDNPAKKPSVLTPTLFVPLKSLSLVCLRWLYLMSIIALHPEPRATGSGPGPGFSSSTASSRQRLSVLRSC